MGLCCIRKNPWWRLRHQSPDERASRLRRPARGLYRRHSGRLGRLGRAPAVVGAWLEGLAADELRLCPCPSDRLLDQGGGRQQRREIAEVADAPVTPRPQHVELEREPPDARVALERIRLVAMRGGAAPLRLRPTPSSPSTTILYRWTRLLLGQQVPSWPIEDAANTLRTMEALFASARQESWQTLSM